LVVVVLHKVQVIYKGKSEISFILHEGRVSQETFRRLLFTTTAFNGISDIFLFCFIFYLYFIAFKAKSVMYVKLKSHYYITTKVGLLDFNKSVSYDEGVMIETFKFVLQKRENVWIIQNELLLIMKMCPTLIFSENSDNGNSLNMFTRHRE
jgi:hypothetical protein